MFAVTKNHQAEETVEGQRIAIVRYGGRAQEPDPGRLPFAYVWVSGAVLAGIACGLGAIALADTYRARSLSAQDVSHPAVNVRIAQTVVPVTYPAEATPEAASAKAARAKAGRQDATLEEIRKRNRRLEALVKVLRLRDLAEHQQAKSHTN